MADFLPVITFHALEDNPTVISFSPSVFRRGLARLHDAGFRTVTLLEAADSVRRGHVFPDRCFAITFDDGYRSVYNEAFPILQGYRMSATVFLTVGVEDSHAPDARLPSLSGRSMLSWREIREMQADGIDFGAHTLTHPDLRRLPRERAQEEVFRSKAIIEDALGVPARSFAYPFGSYDAGSLRLAEQNFECACSANLGFVTLRSDLYALERVDAYYLRSNFLFDLTLTPFFGPYIWARNLFRRFRRTLLLGAH